MLVYSQVSQSRQEERDASSGRQAPKNVCLLVMIGSGFNCDWVKKMAIDISANLKARKSVFTHITSGYVIKRLPCSMTVAAVHCFWYTNMANVTLFENSLY